MKTFDYAIDGIFPVPVYYSFDVKKFTKAELTAVNNHKKNCYGNVGNITSNNTYVLNTKSFSKSFCVNSSLSLKNFSSLPLTSPLILAISFCVNPLFIVKM